MTPDSPIVKPSYEVICRVCKQRFGPAPPLEPPGANGMPTPRMMKMAQKLLEHANRAHPNELQSMVLAANYVYDDPVAIAFTGMWRFMVFQSTRRNYIMNDTIKDRAARMVGASQEVIENALLELRDFLCEDGAFAPPAVQHMQNQQKQQEEKVIA